ncbi:hypothetical protein pipiens_018519, partial [Culex pipiens pipiens]
FVPLPASGGQLSIFVPSRPAVVADTLIYPASAARR